MKKILSLLILIITLALISLYIISGYTNLVSDPTYTISDEIKLILNGNILESTSKSVVKENEIYVGIDIVSDAIGIDVIWDEEDRVAILYTGEDVVRFYGDNSKMKINREKVKDNNSMIIKDGQPFFIIDFIKRYSQYQVVYIQDTNRLIIDEIGKVKRKAQPIDELRLRKSKSVWSEVKDIIKENEIIYVYKIDEEWSFIRSERGYFGYLRNKDIKLGEEFKISIEKKEDISIEKKEKINLTWEFVYGKNPSTKNLKAINGLDVISPTWFYIENEKGEIRDKASKNYVEWAKENGYEIWGLFDNQFDPDLTGKILNSSNSRETVINNIIDLAIKYELEGINIDFENIYQKDKDMLTQFLKELYPVAKENDLTVSIDITIKSLSPNWSLCFDRKNIGRFVDYVILMAYDEHWANGGVSGSVASLPWVEYGIKSLIEDVSSNKVILGVPFYTRIWKEEYIDGELKVKSYAVSMERADELLDKYNGTVTWDEKSKQNYGKYKIGDALYKVWLEDNISMRERVELINKYNLAGIASWRKGFEKNEIWDIIKKNLK